MSLGQPAEQARDPDAAKYDGKAGNPVALGAQQEMPGADDQVSSERLMAMARAAVNHAEHSDLSKHKAAMGRSYRSYNNQHSEGSKYKHKTYSARSKLFVPKTRGAVKKAMVAAAVALFSTADVISVEPGNDADPEQEASAELHRELIRYRLDGANKRGGIPWFPISMGACQDATIAGICVSKQFWEYEELIDEFDVDAPANDNGALAPAPTQRLQKPRVLRDRPMIEPHPPENIICDMAAPFYDVVQGGAVWIVKIPLHVGDVKAMMKKGRQRMGGGAWFDVPREIISQAVSDHSGTGVRTARGQGSDRMSRSNTPNVSDLDIVWVHENFIKLDGRDFHFWSLGTRRLLSAPRETIESYPGHKGDRPYVMGVGEIEAHNAIPMSPVESWRPLQEEQNDFRNLTLDTIKQGISPTAIIRRGAQVDMRQVRERGPDSTIMVNDLETDIRFQEMPGVNPQAFAAADRLSVEFDDLAGGFSQSSVQNNRSLNETVGGMQLLSSSANSVSEFNLRVWVETWVEPVIRQIVALEQHYESDETVMALAGQKSGLFQKYGKDLAGLQATTMEEAPSGDPEMMGMPPAPQEPIDILDLLDRDVTIRVNVGIGAADPLQRLTKFQQGITLLGQAAESGMFGQQVTPKAEPFFDEVLGLCGYKSAARFFDFKTIEEIEQEAEENPPPPDPAQQMAEAQLQMEQQKMEQEFALEQQRMELEAQKTEAEIQKLQLEAQIKVAESEMKQQELAVRVKESEVGLGLKQQEIAFKQQEVGYQGQDLAMRQQGQEKEFALKERAQGFSEQTGEREYGLKDRAQSFTEQSGTQDFGLRQQEFERAGTTGDRDYQLKAAGQNKQVLAEREADQAAPAAPSSTPLEQMMQAMMQQTSAILASMQEQNAATSAQNAQMQDAMLKLMERMSAPKRVVRDEADRVVGVE